MKMRSPLAKIQFACLSVTVSSVKFHFQASSTLETGPKMFGINELVCIISECIHWRLILSLLIILEALQHPNNYLSQALVWKGSPTVMKDILLCAEAASQLIYTHVCESMSSSCSLPRLLMLCTSRAERLYAGVVSRCSFRRYTTPFKYLIADITYTYFTT